ncbi:MAG: hypothetical protein P8Y64_05890 [Gammaproteobacteria bacterium]
MAGELNAQNAAPALASLHATAAESDVLTLELLDLDVEDARALGLLVDCLRVMSMNRAHLVLLHAPQVLAHVLYRTALLEGDARIELVDPREEEPYG